MPIVFVHENIVYTRQLGLDVCGATQREYLLLWFSRGARVGGAKVKLCICAVCGSSGRPVVSLGIFARPKKSPSTGT